MTFTDELGLNYTVGSADSCRRFNEVLEAYLASSQTVMPLLEALIEADGDMPMAHCMRAYVLKLAADPRFDTPFRQIVQRLGEIKANVTHREQRHIEALEAWLRGDLVNTVGRLEGILDEAPKDMVALRVAHYLHFYAGEPERMRDSVARAVAQWHSSEPFYGYLLGMHAFGLEESGEYAAAETTGKRAIELDPTDIWAAHAVQHVFQMQSRFAEGISWTERLMPGFSAANNFAYHMHWHQALCHVGRHELDAALAIYDEHLGPALEDDFYLDVCNAASLLWRLEMEGMDVGDRWDAVNALSVPRLADRELLFSTLHYLMSPARLGDIEAVSRALGNLNEWAQENSTQGALCRTVGLPLARAIVELGRGNGPAAAETLASTAVDIQRIGGSHAQRDLFTQMQMHATR